MIRQSSDHHARDPHGHHDRNLANGGHRGRHDHLRVRGHDQRDRSDHDRNLELT